MRIAYAVISSLLILSGCSYQLDEIRVFVDENRNGTVVANGHKDISANTDLEEIQKDLSQIRERLEDCQLDVLTRLGRREATLEVSSEFSSPDILRSRIRCALPKWKDVDFSVTLDEGILYDTYATQIVMERATVSSKNNGDFPKEFYLTVPGRIISHQTDSSLLAGKIDAEEISRDQISIKVGRGPTLEEEEDRLFEIMERELKEFCDTDQKPPNADIQLETEQFIGTDQEECIKRAEDYHSERLVITIKSQVARFSLEEIIAILGVIFGSGLLIELARRVFKVKLVEEDKRT